MAIVVVLAGMLNLGSLLQSLHAHREASLLQVDEMARIGLATRFNRQKSPPFSGGSRRRLNRRPPASWTKARFYRVHTEVVNRLARLAEDMLALQAAVDEGGQGSAVMADFEAYRNFIISATDLAAIDPRGGMRHAYQAASSYVALTEHTHAIAAAVSTAAAPRGAKARPGSSSSTLCASR